jgi:hypothetical protein
MSESEKKPRSWGDIAIQIRDAAGSIVDVLDEDGATRIFESVKLANEYAEEGTGFVTWRIVRHVGTFRTATKVSTVEVDSTDF